MAGDSATSSNRSSTFYQQPSLLKSIAQLLEQELDSYNQTYPDPPLGFSGMVKNYINLAQQSEQQADPFSVLPTELDVSTEQSTNKDSWQWLMSWLSYLKPINNTVAPKLTNQQCKMTKIATLTLLLKEFYTLPPDLDEETKLSQAYANFMRNEDYHHAVTAARDGIISRVSGILNQLWQLASEKNIITVQEAESWNVGKVTNILNTFSRRLSFK